MSDLFDALSDETPNSQSTLEETLLMWLSAQDPTAPESIITRRMIAAREKYYNGEPIMSDAEFDALEIQLRVLNPKNPLLTAVGVAPSIMGSNPQQGTWPKTSHSFMPMGSLNKIMPSDQLMGSKVDSGIKEWWINTEAKLKS